MTQRVIDFLEPVQIQEQQPGPAAAAPGLADALFQTIMKHLPVGQVGQTVEIGLFPDDGFGLLDFRDIGKDHHPAMNVAIRTVRRVDAEPFGVELAVGVLSPVFPLPAAGRDHRAPHGAVELAIVTRGIQTADVPAHDFGFGASTQFHESRIDIQDDAFGIEHQHAFAGAAIDQGRQFGLAGRFGQARPTRPHDIQMAVPGG